MICFKQIMIFKEEKNGNFGLNVEMRFAHKNTDVP